MRSSGQECHDQVRGRARRRGRDDLGCASNRGFQHSHCDSRIGRQRRGDRSSGCERRPRGIELRGVHHTKRLVILVSALVVGELAVVQHSLTKSSLTAPLASRCVVQRRSSRRVSSRPFVADPPFNVYLDTLTAPGSRSQHCGDNVATTHTASLLTTTAWICSHPRTSPVAPLISLQLCGRPCAPTYLLSGMFGLGRRHHARLEQAIRSTTHCLPGCMRAQQQPVDSIACQWQSVEWRRRKYCCSSAGDSRRTESANGQRGHEGGWRRMAHTQLTRLESTRSCRTRRTDTVRLTTRETDRRMKRRGHAGRARIWRRHHWQQLRQHRTSLVDTSSLSLCLSPPMLRLSHIHLHWHLQSATIV